MALFSIIRLSFLCLFFNGHLSFILYLSVQDFLLLQESSKLFGKFIEIFSKNMEQNRILNVYIE